MKKTYLRIDFKNCPTFGFDYTIVPDISGVNEYLTIVEDDLVDDCKIIISSIKMTEKAYNEWLRKAVKE